jgi:hypothetical protein
MLDLSSSIIAAKNFITQKLQTYKEVDNRSLKMFGVFLENLFFYFKKEKCQLIFFYFYTVKYCF